ncbi:recombinase RecT [Actinomadura violacea]|uniref:Recombinase RecT n=1 Tax=Actinomadura violacea TaxID=2819934 RepID=A0ABS3RY20_9ACTN|nr:recombinase RecT [Actinomadura violacea]MBO2461656.1 recombinase RecT [Actinomadura violacea]
MAAHPQAPHPNDTLVTDAVAGDAPPPTGPPTAPPAGPGAEPAGGEAIEGTVIGDVLEGGADVALAVPEELRKQPVDLAADDGWLDWLGQRRTYFADALPRHVNERHFIQVALTSIKSSRALQNCTPESLTVSLMHCARFGLDPDGTHAAIVPYGRVATFIPMYQGYVDLMYRSGFVTSVVFDWIFEKDDWFIKRGRPAPDDFEHEPFLLSKDRGEVVLAYAFAWLRGGARSQVMALNLEDAEEIRDKYSKAYERAERERKKNPKLFKANPDWGKFNSPWHTNFLAMWLKSAVRALAKRVPKTPELIELMKMDDEADSRVRAAQDADEAALMDEERARQYAAAHDAPDDVVEGEIVHDEPVHDGVHGERAQDAQDAADLREHRAQDRAHPRAHPRAQGGAHPRAQQDGPDAQPAAERPVHAAGVHAADAGARAGGEAQRCEWLLAELGEMAEILGRPVGQLEARLVQRLRCDLEQATSRRLLRLMGQSRPGVVAALREQGRTVEADAYERAYREEMVAPVEVLFGRAA